MKPPPAGTRATREPLSTGNNIELIAKGGEGRRGVAEGGGGKGGEERKISRAACSLSLSLSLSLSGAVSVRVHARTSSAFTVNRNRSSVPPSPPAPFNFPPRAASLFPKVVQRRQSLYRYSRCVAPRNSRQLSKPGHADRSRGTVI